MAPGSRENTGGGYGSSEAPRRGPSTQLDEDDKTGTASSITFSHKDTMRENKGTAIASRYRIDAREFAAGGNGKVFFGQDRQFGDRKVAIKKIIIGSEEKLEAIKRETEIMKTLDHPCICRLLETYEEGKSLFLVMELCEGGELFDRIADDGNVTESVAADIINQISGALNYAHGMGIAHRDLKPENVCLVSRNSSENQIKVIDWGLGFFFGGVTRMKSAVGSLAYAAPEVLEAEDNTPYTSACDLWSLGAMTYVMLSGRPPFWGSVASQLKKMKSGSFPMKDDPWPTISDDAKDFIQQLLKADPDTRLPIIACMEHPWLSKHRTRTSVVSLEAMSRVLWNMEKSSNNSKFLSVCLASAARQMDVQHYKDIRAVFEKLDVNHDGTLDLEELRNGLVTIFGMDSQQAQNVSRMFMQLDLDKNGKIDYTEFCAAALSEKMLEQEHVLWMAFKAFDVHGDDGKITKDEIGEVLARGQVREAWTPKVCDDVAADIVRSFDKDKKGYLDFEAWLTMMRTVAWPEDQCPSDQVLPALSSTAAPASPKAIRRAMSKSMSSHSLGNKISWISLDPRTGQICAYPTEITKIIETHFHLQKNKCELGAKFLNARITFATKDRQAFQRTPNGMRDVRRIEIMAGQDEIEMCIAGSAGEYRFAESSSDGKKQMKIGVLKNAIDASEIKDLIEVQQKEDREASEKALEAAQTAATSSGGFGSSFGESFARFWGGSNTTKK